MDTKHDRSKSTAGAAPRRPRSLWLGLAALLTMATSCTLIVGTFEQSNGTQSGCNTPDDCPAAPNGCVVNTCANHVCGTEFLPVGANLTPNATHDCHGTQCDGNGNVQQVLDTENLPVSNNPCVKGTCDASGKPGTSNLSAGTSCMTSMVCDGMGSCVACLQSTDCPTGQACTAQHMCVPESCKDGVQDGNETDVDCGGGTCSPCDDGKKCSMSPDCGSKVCTTGACQAATCMDGVQNGNETDADCGGGTCPKCGPNKTCMNNNDCAGAQCGGGTCTPDCSDAVQNGSETDVDCGGGTCTACATTKKCKVDTDCASQACDANTLVCVADQCNDHQIDGAETDTDCGGGTCPGCIVGKKCHANGDCASAACDANTMLCTSTQCMDGQQDGAETDTDCGGGVCAACANGKKCKADGDCTSDACDATNHVCDADQCMDGQKDGQETDVDCGGGACPTCAVGKGCSVNGDCTNNACDNATGKCATSQCADQKQDGAETDTDCGGGACPACALNKKCNGDTDCTSSACDAQSHLCVSNQCADHQKDGVETDTDCGGGVCGTCGLGLKCNGDSDCTSNACDGQSLTCVSMQCADHRQDGTETDTDCGGSVCTARCVVGQKCQIDTDCASQACDGVAHVCDSTQCSDHQKDGSETDVDCGGGTCATCAVNQQCLINSDCTSNACNLGASPHVCATSQCGDGQKDGAETDTDCGGGTCPTCGTGRKCQIDGDCTSNACDAATLTCVTDQCSDHRQDGLETDVDCGGGICSACPIGNKCGADTDCGSNACSFCASPHTCTSNQCADCHQDGAETDVDCGGGACSACTVGKKCLTNFDCQSGHICNASKVCQ